MRDMKHAIRSAFGSAASTYDSVAEVQQRIAARLLEATPRQLSGRILDAGCGTCFGAHRLAQHNPEAQVIGLDAAFGMFQQARLAHAVCGDIETLPLQNDSIQLYWSSLAWQWTQPSKAAAEAFRVLDHGGALRVATLGPRTMCELRETFAGIDHYSHVRTFDSLDTHIQALADSGFCDIHVDCMIEQTFSPDLASLMRAIRLLGAHVLDQQRRSGMLGRTAWMQLVQAYEQYRTNAGLPTSYDVFYLSARKP